MNNFVVYNAFFNKSPARHYVDNFRRQESTAWMLPSDKRQQQNPRPFSEQNENSRLNRIRTYSEENDAFKNRRQATTIEYKLELTISKNERVFDFNRTSSAQDNRKPFSAFTTSYGHHYSPNSLPRETTKTSSSSLVSFCRLMFSSS